MDSTFIGLSLIIVIGALVALGARLVRQPMTISYIVTGILVGPAFFNIAAKSPDTLSLFSEIGIALLLFIIGLGLNPAMVREVSRPAAIICLSQLAAVTVIGAMIGSAFGLTGNESLFLGAGLAFSSTIIVLKLLSDKNEQHRLYGKIAISVALVQDLVAFILILVTSAAGHHTVSIGSLFSLALKAAVVGWLIYAISYRVLGHYRKLIADNQEFLFLFAMAWGLGSAALFSKIGLSSEIGALFAGVCLASLPYAQEISARLRPLRDFFLIVFFISLGANLTFSSISSHIGLIVAGLIVAVVIKPLFGLAAMGWLGYTKRTSFKTASALGQVSEFSIVLVLLGFSKGLVSGAVVSVLVLITMLSIAASTYVITFSDKLFAYLEHYLDLFERRKTHGEPLIREKNDLVLFGYQKGGHEFVKAFRRLKRPFVVIDYDPEVIDTLERKRINHLYGDVTDIELLEEAGVPNAKLIVSTTDDLSINKWLLEYLDKANPTAVVIVQSDSPKDAAKLYHLGASYVILPHLIGSEKIGAFIRSTELKRSSFKKHRDRHLKYLQNEFGALDEAADHDHLGQTILKSVTKLTKSS